MRSDRQLPVIVCWSPYNLKLYRLCCRNPPQLFRRQGIIGRLGYGIAAGSTDRLAGIEAAITNERHHLASIELEQQAFTALYKYPAICSCVHNQGIGEIWIRRGLRSNKLEIDKAGCPKRAALKINISALSIVNGRARNWIHILIDCLRPKRW